MEELRVDGVAGPLLIATSFQHAHVEGLAAAFTFGAEFGENARSGRTGDAVAKCAEGPAGAVGDAHVGGDAELA